MNSSALSSRNFQIYLTGSTISLHGLWVYRVALGWFAWEISGSEFWVGIIAFTQFAPAVIFGPVFGVFADRFDRRRASIIINACSALNNLLLAALVFLGRVDIIVLAALSFMQGCLDGAHTPVRMTIVPNLVSKDRLQSAIASTSISFNVSRFVGPALAGIVIATLGVGAAFAMNGISYLAIIVAVSIVQLNAPPARMQKPGDVWAELFDGVRYVAGHGTIRELLIIIAFASVFGRGALEMLPAFADAVFARGSAGLAILTSAVGVGAIATGIILSRSTAWLTSGFIRYTVILSGALIVLFGANSVFWLAVPTVVALGVLLSLCGVGSQILIQSLVEEEVRGRVSSLWGMVAFGGTALGSLVVGSSSAAFGLQGTVVVTGFFCIVAALLTHYLTMRSRRTVPGELQ